MPNELKRPIEYWRFRIGVCAAVVVAIASFVAFLHWPPAFVLVVPCALCYTLSFFNAMAFPFAYSVFGPYRKTPPPTGNPLFDLSPFGSRVGECMGGGAFIHWRFFREGVAIWTIVGTVWLPWKRVRRVVRSGKLMIFMDDSPEVRPVVAFSITWMSKRDLDAFYSLMKELRQERRLRSANGRPNSASSSAQAGVPKAPAL